MFLLKRGRSINWFRENVSEDFEILDIGLKRRRHIINVTLQKLILNLKKT